MNRKHISIFTGVLILFVLFSSSAFLQGVLESAVEAVGESINNNPFLGPLLFVLLAAGSVMLGPFTSTPLVPLVLPVWGTTLTLVYLLLGWMIGDIVSYFLGRSIGYPIARLFVPQEQLNRWIKILSDRIDIYLAFLFRVATLSETGYIFGMLKYSFVKYLIITVIAEILFALITVYAGDAFINAGWKTFVALGIGWVALMGLALRLLSKKLKRPAGDLED